MWLSTPSQYLCPQFSLSQDPPPLLLNQEVEKHDTPLYPYQTQSSPDTTTHSRFGSRLVTRNDSHTPSCDTHKRHVRHCSHGVYVPRSVRICNLKEGQGRPESGSG